MTIQDQITAAATAYGVDPALALAVATQESGLNQNARGAAGEIGVFQLMPATAASLGVDPTNLADNIAGGVRYLASMLSQFGGDPSKALAAYNWGPGNVAAWGDSWMSHAPTSTVNYVSGILSASGSAVDSGGAVVADSVGSGLSADEAVSTSQDLMLAVGIIGLVALLFWIA